MSESVVVTFENAQHAEFHRVLVEAGFVFTVGAQLMVGRVYTHERKQLTITLIGEGDGSDGELEYTVSVTRDDKPHAITDKDYSVAEWTWIDEPDVEADKLARELYILVNIRPRMLYAACLALPEEKGDGA